MTKVLYKGRSEEHPNAIDWFLTEILEVEIEDIENFVRVYLIENGQQTKSNIVTALCNKKQINREDYRYDNQHQEHLVDLVVNTALQNLSEKNKIINIKRGIWKICSDHGSNCINENTNEAAKEEFYTNKMSLGPYNYLIFGAPGTGKSYYIDQKRCGFRNIKRVTFYSTYSYSQFVGSYKPVMNENENIAYEFVPGPFLEMLYDATTNPNGNKYLLVIEEINRAEAASVFGDMFQLLDRDGNGKSTYSIFASLDVRKWWNKKEGNKNLNVDVELRIPSNMYIWATMNSADQGVFPLDTAFKRRWSFEYMPLDNENAAIAKSEVEINDSTYRWDDIRKGINKYLKDKRINEDKMLGQYFLSENEIENNFNDSFKYKVLMYLYEDAARAYRADLFGNNTFSEVLSNFDNFGLGCFNGKINIDPITSEDGPIANDQEDNN